MARLDRLVIDDFKADPGTTKWIYVYEMGPPHYGAHELKVLIDDRGYVTIDGEAFPVEDYAPCIVSKEALPLDKVHELWEHIQ